MKVILDTNVLVSALLGGRCTPILDLFRKKRFQHFLTLTILEEYTQVLQRPIFSAPPSKVQKVLIYLYRHSHVVIPSQEVNLVHQDPSDNKFLSCALEARVDFIVTGDHHLLQLGSFHHTTILSPHEFLKLFR